MIARRHTPGKLHIYRLIPAAVTLHHFLQARSPVIVGQGIGQADLRQTARQSLQMLLQSEQTTAVYRDHFVDTVTEDESPIHDRDLCPLDRQEFSVEIDDSHNRAAAIQTTA